ncbi:hypothetical protein Q8F55_001256 [Vanrija albida]|uniref:Uncharacterized protein n=1 Tax=Vanrija albida TaxID=181172 RepID=A0ABR3QG74_9TREE
MRTAKAQPVPTVDYGQVSPSGAPPPRRKLSVTIKRGFSSYFGSGRFEAAEEALTSPNKANGGARVARRSSTAPPKFSPSTSGNSTPTKTASDSTGKYFSDSTGKYFSDSTGKYSYSKTSDRNNSISIPNGAPGAGLGGQPLDPHAAVLALNAAVAALNEHNARFAQQQGYGGFSQQQSQGYVNAGPGAVINPTPVRTVSRNSSQFTSSNGYNPGSSPVHKAAGGFSQSPAEMSTTSQQPQSSFGFGAATQQRSYNSYGSNGSPPVQKKKPLPSQSQSSAQLYANSQGNNSTSRLAALYSRWTTGDTESDDENIGYGTPEEGGFTDDESAAGHGHGHRRKKSASKSAHPKPIPAAQVHAARNAPLPPSSVVATTEGPKLNRKKATGMSIRQEFHHGDPADINQGAVLATDLDLCRDVLRLFLESRMKECEEGLRINDPDNNHLYLQVGNTILSALKGMMTFDSSDLLSALDIAKSTSHIASSLRHPTESVFSKLGGLVRTNHAVARVKAMTVLELHAELCYAECILMKAVLAIVAGGDWMGLIREALNMRTAHGIYKTLQQFLDEADKGGFDETIDMDFRSGVLLGSGTSALILSLLPAKVLKVAEVFGFLGDRDYALKTLMAAGGWSANSDLPAYNEETEGVRRPICDMVILVFHLVISVLMPVSHVDIPTARKIVNYNLGRYPTGIFFLYFQARLMTSQCEPERANESLQKALDLDLEYVQLQHMCLWDYGCNYLITTQYDGARQCFEILRSESNWSRAVYTYISAATMMMVADDPRYPEATTENILELMAELPKLGKKLAGKSLPIEKMCLRKGRKYLAQGNYLFLPAMELSYSFGLIGHAPKRLLVDIWIPRITAALEDLESQSPETYGNGVQYWDDYVLGHFLRGVCQFIARYQPPEATAEALRVGPGAPTDKQLDAGAEADFKKVIAASPQVRLDHWMLFHNHYELGRLYAKRGDKKNARINFDVVINNKLPTPNLYTHKGQGKYSMEGALQIKTHSAISNLDKK